MTGNHELVPDSGGKDADVQRVLPLSAPTAGSAPASAAPATMPSAPSAPASAASQLAHVEDTSLPRDWVALMKDWWQHASLEERREFLSSEERRVGTDGVSTCRSGGAGIN